jgi:hypothetical protein
MSFSAEMMAMMASMTAEQLKALAKTANEQSKTRDSREFNALVVECKEVVEKTIIDYNATASIKYEDVIRKLAEDCGVAVKQKKGRGAKKGKATGYTRASGKRGIMAWILLLTEERRKYKITGRPEPTLKNSTYALVKAMKAPWEYLKGLGHKNNDDVFQKANYSLWTEDKPLENCTPYFAKWWKECEDKKAYETNTDWKKYFIGVTTPPTDEGEAEVDALIAKTEAVKKTTKKKVVKKTTKKKVVKKKSAKKEDEYTALGRKMFEDAKKAQPPLDPRRPDAYAVEGENGKTYESIEELEADGNETDCDITGGSGCSFIDNMSEEEDSDYSED